MNEPKRPQSGDRAKREPELDAAKAAPAGEPAEGDSFFNDADEHDGYGPIRKRIASDPPPE